MQIMAWWIVLPCSFSVMCQHTEGTCCLHQARWCIPQTTVHFALLACTSWPIAHYHVC